MENRENNKGKLEKDLTLGGIAVRLTLMASAIAGGVYIHSAMTDKVFYHKVNEIAINVFESLSLYTSHTNYLG